MAFDRAGFDTDAYLASCAHPCDYDLRVKIDEWRSRGVVIFEGAVDGAAIDRLFGDIEALCKSPKEFDLEIEVRGERRKLAELDFDPRVDTGVKFNCLEAISLAARDLSLNRFACSFLAHVFQEPPVVLQSLTFWRGSNQPAHTDYPYVRTQSKLAHLAASWIPLEDVHPDSGPLAYYPGSHRPEIVRPFDWGGGSVVLEPDSVRTPGELAPYLHAEMSSAGLKAEVFTPRRGDLLIWHGCLVHEGTTVRDPARTRKSYVTHYTSKSARPRLHEMADAEETGRYTERNGGRVYDRPWVRDGRRLPSWNGERQFPFGLRLG